MPVNQTPPHPAPQRVLLNASYAPSLINFRGTFIEAMAAAGHEVHASAPEMTADVAGRLRALGAKPHDVSLSRAGLSPSGDLRYGRQLEQLIRTIKANLVVSYTIKPNIWGAWAARRAGVRSASLVTGLGYAFIEGAGLKRRLVRGISRALYRRATAANEIVIFQNPDDRADFISAGCLADTSKARTINGSGVDMSWYVPAPLPTQPVLLMISRLLGNKGVREYAAAAAQVLSRRRDCRFLLVGYPDEGPDGIAPAELEQWQAAGVNYLGHLDDVRGPLREASIYVLPSYREGTPRSVLEAMAMGRPIITTDVPGCRETVIDGRTGLLVPARDPDALARAMERLIDDPEGRLRMGQQSLSLCRERYDVDKVNEALLRHLSLA